MFERYNRPVSDDCMMDWEDVVASIVIVCTLIKIYYWF